MRRLHRVFGGGLIILLASAAPMSTGAQFPSTPEHPLLIIDASITYKNAAGAPNATAPVDSLVSQLRKEWSLPFGAATPKGHVVIAAPFDALGTLGEPSIIQASPVSAINDAALNAVRRIR